MRKEPYKSRPMAEPQLIRRLRELKDYRDRGIDPSHAEKRVNELLSDATEVSAALTWLSGQQAMQKLFEIHQKRIQHIQEMSTRTDLTISEGMHLTAEMLKVVELHRKSQEGAE